MLGIRTSSLIARLSLGWFILAFAFPVAGRAASGKADRVLTAGRAAMEDGLYDLAEKNFTRFIHMNRKADRKAKGALYLAQTYYYRGQYDEVLSLLAEYTEPAAGTELEGDYVYWTAKANFQKGAFAEVLAGLDTFPQQFPATDALVPALRLRVHALLSTAETNAALKAFAEVDQALGEDPEAAENLLEWAGILLELDRMDEAEELLGRIVEKFPGAPPAWNAQLWLAALKLDEGRPAATRQLLTDLVGSDAPEKLRGQAWVTLATAHEVETNLLEAIDALVEGARLAPSKEQKNILNMLQGSLRLRAGEVEKGLALFKSSIVEVTNRSVAASAQLDVAEQLMRAELYELAADAFQTYIEAFTGEPGYADAVMGKAWSLWHRERYAEAAAAFEKAYALSDESEAKEQALFKAADAYFANAQFSTARPLYEQCIAEFPESVLRPQAEFQRAECLARTGDADLAMKTLAELAKTYTDSSLAEQALMRLAVLREKAGDWEGAIGSYTEILEAFPGGLFFAPALEGRGLVKYRLGQFEDALADFEAVVEKFPDGAFDEQAFYMRGWCLYLMGQNERALEICTTFVEQYPGSVWAPNVLFWLGEYHYNEGSYGEAETRFGALAEAYPDANLADDALYWAGRAAAMQMEYLRAIEHYTRLSKNYAGSPLLAETRFAQGDALSELGDFSRAILAFEEIIKKFPDSYLVNQAWGRMGDCQFTLANDDATRYQKALACYRTILDNTAVSGGMLMQAEYKIGRCYEKMGVAPAALEHYMNVVYRYFEELEKGRQVGILWFTRSAFAAAAIKEAEEAWPQAVNIYRRVMEADVPAAPDAERRIQKIRVEHWFPLLKGHTGESS